MFFPRRRLKVVGPLLAYLQAGSGSLPPGQSPLKNYNRKITPLGATPPPPENRDDDDADDGGGGGGGGGVVVIMMMMMTMLTVVVTVVVVVIYKMLLHASLNILFIIYISVLSDS